MVSYYSCNLVDQVAIVSLSYIYIYVYVTSRKTSTDIAT